MAVRLSIVLFCSGTADLQLWLRETYKAGSQGEKIAKGGLQLFENLGHNWLAVLNGRLPWSWIPRNRNGFHPNRKLFSFRFWSFCQKLQCSYAIDPNDLYYNVIIFCPF